MIRIEGECIKNIYKHSKELHMASPQQSLKSQTNGEEYIIVRHTCQVALDISRSPIEIQLVSR